MRAVPDAFRNGQRGAALLAFMLVIIVAAATMLLGRMNEHAQAWARDRQTQMALTEAKRALLSFAMNYPDFYTGSFARGPGYLPCPDQNDNGFAEANCAVTTGSTVGRLPYKSLGLGDLRDSTGELLWYSVSQDFKYNQPANHVINSERPGTVEVDGAGDVVAVVIAPGRPFGAQSGRRGGAETAAVSASTIYTVVAQYLEEDNATNTDASFQTSGGSEFNDRVETVTRRELVEVIEKRVLSEVRDVMASYRSTYSAYPWLAPFADPKVEFRGFIGSHDGSNNASDLTDTSVNFLNELGVRAGDLVRNLTDGSVATVISDPTTATLLDLGPLTQGTDNDFDVGDVYQVLPAWPWTAAAASSGSTLVDNLVDGFGNERRDFVEIGVIPGDVIDNITDGTSGIVEAVSGAQITLTSGSGVDFSTNDQYVIRSRYGRATGANDSTSLTDSTKNFLTAGVRVGDLVANLSDGSVGRVTAVSANSLTLAGTYLGTDNDFDTGDYYYLPRLNTDYATREGMLSIHEEGKHFATSFSMNSNLAIAPATTVDAASPHSSYVSNLSGAASSALTSASVGATEGQCVWMAEGEATCLGIYLDPNFPVQGTVTAGTNTNVLTDSNAKFVTTGIKRGDMVFNFDDEVATGVSGTATSGTSSYILEDTSKNFVTLGITPYYHLLHNTSGSNARALVTEVINATTLRVAQFQSGDTVDLDPGENYTIYGPQRSAVASVSSSTVLTASQLVSTFPDFDNNGGGGSGTNAEFYRVAIATGLTATRTADFASSGTTLVDAGANFSEIARGDIVENITDSAFGLITAVNDATDTLTAQLYALDGSTRSFSSGEQYRIFYNHDVVTRRHEFRPHLSGSSYVYVSGKQRKRDVCLGYTGNCASSSGNVPLPAQSGIVVIRDFDGNGDEVAQSRVDIPSGTNGTQKVSGVDYYLREASNELPAWFLHNRWHQLVYAAYSAGYAASGVGSCDADGGTPPPACLTLTIASPSATLDRHALVVAAGEPLASQNRSGGGVTQYFESENNTGGNDLFLRQDATSLFNDLVSVICPDAKNAACP